MIVWTRLGIWAVIIYGGLVAGYRKAMVGRLEGWNYEFGEALTQVIASSAVLLWGLYLHRWNYTKVVDKDGEELKHAVFGFPMEWIGGAMLLHGLGSFIFLLVQKP